MRESSSQRPSKRTDSCAACVRGNSGEGEREATIETDPGGRRGTCGKREKVCQVLHLRQGITVSVNAQSGIATSAEEQGTTRIAVPSVKSETAVCAMEVGGVEFSTMPKTGRTRHHQLPLRTRQCHSLLKVGSASFVPCSSALLANPFRAFADTAVIPVAHATSGRVFLVCHTRSWSPRSCLDRRFPLPVPATATNACRVRSPLTLPLRLLRSQGPRPRTSHPHHIQLFLAEQTLSLDFDLGDRGSRNRARTSILGMGWSRLDTMDTNC